MIRRTRQFVSVTTAVFKHGIESEVMHTNGKTNTPNKALHSDGIPLRSIAAGELGR